MRLDCTRQQRHALAKEYFSYVQWDRVQQTTNTILCVLQHITPYKLQKRHIFHSRINEGFVNTSILFICILIHCTYVQSRT
jgi:hypothetical protein